MPFVYYDIVRGRNHDQIRALDFSLGYGKAQFLNGDLDPVSSRPTEVTHS
jgi:hypothetical protein